MLHVRHRDLCLVQSTRMAMAVHAAAAVAAQAQASDDALQGRILVYDLRLLRHCGTLTLGSLCPVLPVLRLFFFGFSLSFLFVLIYFAALCLDSHRHYLFSPGLLSVSHLWSLLFRVVYIKVRWNAQSISSHTYKTQCPLPGRPELELHRSGRTGCAVSLTTGPLPIRFFIGQRTTNFHDEWLSGRPLWGLHPLRGQCRNRWGSMWGRHFSTVHRVHILP